MLLYVHIFVFKCCFISTSSFYSNVALYPHPLFIQMLLYIHILFLFKCCFMSTSSDSNVALYPHPLFIQMLLYVHIFWFKCCFASTETVRTIRNGQRPHSSSFFHGAFRPQKPYGLLGTREEWDREWEPESPGPPACSHSSCALSSTSFKVLHVHKSRMAYYGLANWGRGRGRLYTYRYIQNDSCIKMGAMRDILMFY